MVIRMILQNMWERVLVKRFTILTQKQLIACHPVATAPTNSNSKYANVYARIFVHFKLLTTLKMADPTDIQQDRVGHAENIETVWLLQVHRGRFWGDSNVIVSFNPFNPVHHVISFFFHWTDRKTDGQTNRQTDKQTDKQAFGRAKLLALCM